MRKCLLIAGFVLMMIGATGCVVIDVESVQSCRAGWTCDIATGHPVAP